jgi:serine/threonine-protein kinase
MPSAQRLVSSPGLVVGTVGYLSPEQLRGEQADHRADVFAFGVILYELLTGGRPFEGNSPADVTAAILKEEPRDPSETSRAIAPALNKIVRRCLEKNPERRFQSASDLCFALDLLSPISTAVAEVQSAPAPPHRAGGSQGRGRWRLPAVPLLTGLIGAAVSGTVVWKIGTMMPRTPQPTARFVLPVPTAEVVEGDLDVSPDGAYLAYSTGRAGGKKLYLQILASPGVAPLAEIEGGDGPFFSPDSQWLGFFADGKMKKISVHGGAPIALADAPANWGADWGEHGSIVFAPIARAGLFTVSESGGVPEALTTPDAERSETSHASPQWLPGNKAIVYVARAEAEAGNALVALSLKDRRRNVLVQGADSPRFVSTGHLAYLEGDALKAVTLDPGTLAIAGTPTVMVEGVVAYGVSDTGMLIHAPSAPSGVPGSRLVWVDRRGSTEPLGAPARAYANPRLSPEGRRLAVSIANTPDNNIWIYDLVRDSFAQLTFQGRNGWPVWNRDGRYVMYASNRAGTTYDIYRKSADGTGAAEPLLIKPFLQIPHNLSRDGRFLGLSEISPASVQTSLLSMSDSTLTAGITNGWTPSLSPDGRWVAYVSNEAGRYEIYVRPMLGAAGKWLISTDGGVEPLWSASGSELFYRRGNQVLAVDVVTHTAFEYGKPRVLFEGRYRLGGVNRDDTRNCDVTVDGQRFLMLEDTTPPARTHLNVVVNWFGDLERVVAARK